MGLVGQRLTICTYIQHVCIIYLERGVRISRQVAKNRRTFLAFPEASDPINRQLQQVGAMSTDRRLPEPSPVAAATQRPRPSLDRPSALQADAGRSSPGKPRSAAAVAAAAVAAAAAAASAPAIGRPGTSDVGNYTQSLGIRPR
jgi:hypothetical protein